jgi:hypothetical protein
MAEFVRAQIFGTTFEITSRYAGQPGAGGVSATSCLRWEETDFLAGTRIFNLSAWARLVWFGELGTFGRIDGRC